LAELRFFPLLKRLRNLLQTEFPGKQQFWAEPVWQFRQGLFEPLKFPQEARLAQREATLSAPREAFSLPLLPYGVPHAPGTFLRLPQRSHDRRFRQRLAAER